VQKSGKLTILGSLNLKFGSILAHDFVLFCISKYQRQGTLLRFSGGQGIRLPRRRDSTTGVREAGGHRQRPRRRTRPTGSHGMARVWPSLPRPHTP